MKILLLATALTLFLVDAQGQKTIYEYEIATADGSKIPVSGFKGSKLFIAVASPEQLEKGVKRFLDSIQKAYPKIVVIAVPSSDFGGSRNESIIAEIKSSSQSKIFVASLTAVTKAKGAQQNSLFQWLSNASLNRHFEADVVGDVQFYLVSESGVLYSVLEKGVPPEVITTVLKQEDVKE